MENPKFSIIIPTRERAETLKDSIRTCLNQDYLNYEIVVCDNFSQDDTYKIVKEFNSSKIVYVNTNNRINMTSNWEFSLNYSNGDYITILGDDDGLIPGALTKMAKIISETGVMAITWNWASYYWPNAILNNLRNLLVIPTRKGGEIRSVKKMLEKVLKFQCEYSELPFLYKGCVSSPVIKCVKENSGGKFFHSSNPDLYSSIALSPFIENYYYSYEPLSINGTSGASNGASSFNRHISSDSAKIFESEGNIPFHKNAIFCNSIPMVVYECLAQAQDVLPILKSYSIDKKRLIDTLVRDAYSSSKWRFKEILEATSTFADQNQLLDYFHQVCKNRKYKDPDIRGVIGMSPGYNFFHKHIIVKGDLIGINNIYDASIISGVFINRKFAFLSISKIAALISNFKYICNGLRIRVLEK